MLAFKEDDYNAFCEDCESAVTDINDAEEIISGKIFPAYQLKSLGESFSRRMAWWKRVCAPIHKIYVAETEFLKRLKDWVDYLYEKKELTSEILIMCQEIIDTTDLAARKAKCYFGEPVMDQPSLKRGRPQVRNLVRLHWKVHDEIEKNHKLPEDLRLNCTSKLSNAMMSLKWIWGIVVSYSRKDRDDLIRLLEIVEPKLKEHHIHVWWDKRIGTGCSWGEEIEEEFTRRDLAVTLVSKEFFKSEFIKDKEVGVLTARRQDRKKGVVIYPIILDVCNWKQHKWIDPTQYLPSNGKSVRKDFTDEEKFKELGAKIAIELTDIMDKLSNPHEAIRYMRSYERA